MDGRIIMVSPEDHHLHVKKVEMVRKIVDTELGFVTDSPFRRQEATTFFFVSVNKRVVGCGHFEGSFTFKILDYHRAVQSS